MVEDEYKISQKPILTKNPKKSEVLESEEEEAEGEVSKRNSERNTILYIPAQTNTVPVQSLVSESSKSKSGSQN